MQSRRLASFAVIIVTIGTPCEQGYRSQPSTNSLLLELPDPEFADDSVGAGRVDDGEVNLAVLGESGR